MSIPHPVTITCPQCHASFSHTIWDSVNTDLSPDLPQKIISGDFFSFDCPACGFRGYTQYMTLYHDLKHSAMIWLVPEGCRQREYISEYIEEIRSVFAIPTETTRIVYGTQQLAEKVSALEAGRDDRVIELCKLFLIESLIGYPHRFELPQVYYNCPHGDEYFILVDHLGTVRKYPFDDKEYKKKAYLLKNVLAVPMQSFVSVDPRWTVAALDHLGREAISLGLTLEQLIERRSLQYELELLQTTDPDKDGPPSDITPSA